MNKAEQQINNYFHQLKSAFPEFDTQDKKIFESSETDFPFSWKDPLKAADNVLKMLDDEVLATALLDRLLFHCEIIKLSGKSYRLKNRESFFDNQN